MKSPNPSNTHNAQLFSVATLSPNDIWTVGTYSDTNNVVHALIEHWNGFSWSIASSPIPDGSGDQLHSIVAISSSSVWGVGYYSDSLLVQQTLIEHWNGTKWSIVSSPEPKGSAGNQLLSVTAVSANNVWAVGTSESQRGSSTLIEHWNGSAWSIVSSPNTLSSGNTLSGATAISDHNVWAVGTSYSQSGNPSQTLIEHWSGSTWSIVSSPNVASSQHDDLLSIAAVSASNIWAVGRWDTGSQSYRTLIEHWNGTGWSIASGPNVGAIPNALQAVTRGPASNTIWAVGFHFSNNLFAPLIERYC